MNNIAKRFPINGTFELTGRCNLSCKMCLMRVDQSRIRSMNLHERTAKEWIDMAKQAADAGTLYLLLTGGEIMLRPDFCEIYEEIAQIGFLLTIYTNATMVTEEIMTLLRRLPPHKIGVTMYGANNKTYQRLCKCDSGYDRFIDGIKQLSSLPSLFDIRTTIVSDNLCDLQQMKDFTKKTFGPDKILHISRNVVNKIRGGIACPKEVRLTPEENIDLIFPELNNLREQLTYDKKDDFQKQHSKLVLRHKTPKNGYIFHHCGAGINEYSINWAGRMYACEMLDQGYTKPFQEGFLNAWKRLPEQYPIAHSIVQCESCKYAALCETCPANRLAETGNWFGVPEYACRESKYLYQILSDIGAI